MKGRNAWVLLNMQMNTSGGTEVREGGGETKDRESEERGECEDGEKE